MINKANGEGMKQKDQKSEIYLSIIVPFKNEEARLEITVNKILDYITKHQSKIQLILADSHSTDRSLVIAKSYARKFEYIEYTEPKDQRKGKGQAVQDGIEASIGQYILFMDADSSTEISEVDKLLPFIKQNEIVMGSRYIKKPQLYQENYIKALSRGLKSLVEVIVIGHSKDYMAKGKQGRLRQFISRGGNLAFSALLNQNYVDQRCGFKLYQAPIAKFLAGLQRIYDWGFDTEYLAIAQKYKFKTIEIPVEWIDVVEGARVKPVMDSINSFSDIFKVQANLIIGNYSKRKARQKLGPLFEEVIINRK